MKESRQKEASPNRVKERKQLIELLDGVVIKMK